jgi:dihydropteroate synthase
MHMVGEPGTMQLKPRYANVTREVGDFLRERVDRVCGAGVDASRLILDPGYGFGKSDEDNLTLMREQQQLLALGYPILVGWSRKGTLGRLTGGSVHERLAASVTAALVCVARGARVLRVHDVKATRDALTIWQAAGMLGQGDASDCRA